MQFPNRGSWLFRHILLQIVKVCIRLLGLDFILFAQTIALMKSLSLGITPDNPCPTGEVNRVVKGVTLYPYTLK